MEQPNYIAGILEGDGAVLRHLYHQQYPFLLRLVRDYGGAESDIKDVFQDAVLLVFQKAQQPDFQLTSKFSTYFFGICRHLWLNMRTKKAATAEVTLSEDAKYIPDSDLLADDLLHVEQGNLFWNAFQQLGADCQQVLEYFFQKLSMETIAQKMGYGSEGYAKRRKSQCKNRLIELIQNAPEYQELIR